ncbi:unnamed protein product [Rotaria magnacalcarata]|uniref:Kazal-like domain-containing protein n=1 Tax=Rotaria magnacalcarata TaxID=392030 RepID=A0A815NTK1_9BILA|nr:unnamed protein product [Rotaria magnacalcarata]CAF2070138.1 unnamed protein product [Rotaria magnacalcarata]CAF3915027.1 unnamed protein product [Rotaria magnacalcarata]CAF3916935.1 unnamed protein product [Rotaria magnacalcarata]
MPFSSLSQTLILIVIVTNVFDQNISIVQAGNCFFRRIDNLCYDLSEADIDEQLCTGTFYSDDNIQELDDYVYADNCRDVNVLPKACDFDCGLGQECQWINGKEMCVCSEASCISSNIEQQPVCGSNNMTFNTECAMEAWKCSNQQSALYKKYDGECQKDCRNVRCPHDTVCLLVKNTGEPICYPKTHCKPTLSPESVCGTDGITYPNICVMRLSPNRQGQTAELAHEGHCENSCRPGLCKPDERCVYSKELRPVCIRCQYSSRFILHSGECSSKIPVCGDNGNSYKSYCSLLMAQCRKNLYIDIVGYDTCSTLKHKKGSKNKSKYLNRVTILKTN